MGRDPNPVTIAQEVASDYCLTLDELRGRSRRAYLTEPRREAAYRIWRETDLTLAEIGAILDRSYSTVIYHLRMRDLRT